MTGVLSTLLNLSTLVFAVTGMLSVGFSYTLNDIIKPLRNVRRVLVALLANFVLIPLLAYAVTRLLTLAPSMEIGLILVSTAAGAPFLIKLTQWPTATSPSPPGCWFCFSSSRWSTCQWWCPSLPRMRR
jgi:predicted Na+-dependent transporter